MKMSKSQLYVFKVSLSYSKKIWRRIEILGHQSLDQLHEIIFDAFDRYDQHMYSFYLTKQGSKSRNRFFDAPEFTHPFALEENFGFADKQIQDASKTKISDLPIKEKSKFEYLFDFGDEWLHVITLEKILDIFPNQKYPIVSKKVGDSPDQCPDFEDDDDFE
jgi:Plasmid pRiA4b ORF-3-like protein